MIAPIGCRSGSPAEQGLAKPAAAPARPAVPEISPSDIEVFDARMWRSEARILYRGRMSPLGELASCEVRHAALEHGAVNQPHNLLAMEGI